jgi:hypothetical protein
MTIVDVISDAVRAALAQTDITTTQASDIAVAAARNAVFVLQGMPVHLINAAMAFSGAAEIRAARMPAGHLALDIQVETRQDACDLADRLGMPDPEHVSNGINEWWVSERGDYGFERVGVIGGHRPICQCHGRAT